MQLSLPNDKLHTQHPKNTHWYQAEEADNRHLKAHMPRWYAAQPAAPTHETACAIEGEMSRYMSGRNHQPKPVVVEEQPSADIVAQRHNAKAKKTYLECVGRKAVECGG